MHAACIIRRLPGRQEMRGRCSAEVLRGSPPPSVGQCKPASGCDLRKKRERFSSHGSNTSKYLEGTIGFGELGGHAPCIRNLSNRDHGSPGSSWLMMLHTQLSAVSQVRLLRSPFIVANSYWKDSLRHRTPKRCMTGTIFLGILHD